MPQEMIRVGLVGVTEMCIRDSDITGHVIVALVGGEIVKVECRACGSVHKYYPCLLYTSGSLLEKAPLPLPEPLPFPAKTLTGGEAARRESR